MCLRSDREVERLVSPARTELPELQHLPRTEDVVKFDGFCRSEPVSKELQSFPIETSTLYSHNVDSLLDRSCNVSRPSQTFKLCASDQIIIKPHIKPSKNVLVCIPILPILILRRLRKIHIQLRKKIIPLLILHPAWI